MLILVSKTAYGYRAEVATSSNYTPNEKQVKRIDKFIKSQRSKPDNSFNNFR